MADRIVVMNHGHIEQIGAPQEIYGSPASAFVADFVGSMNFLAGRVAGPGRISLGDGLAIDCAHTAPANGEIRVCLRPEDVQVRGITESTVNRFPVTIAELEFLGSFCRATLHAAAPGVTLTADFSINLMRDLDVGVGKTLDIALPADRLRVFAGEAAG